jgi:hypothetical protein
VVAHQQQQLLRPAVADQSGPEDRCPGQVEALGQLIGDDLADQLGRGVGRSERDLRPGLDDRRQPFRVHDIARTQHLVARHHQRQRLPDGGLGHVRRQPDENGLQVLPAAGVHPVQHPEALLCGRQRAARTGGQALDRPGAARFAQ